jgi:CHAP domain
MTLAAHITRVAKNEIGVEEINGTNCGPRVNQYKSATNLPPKEAWPWCAAFVCWVVKKSMTVARRKFTFTRPTTAGAWDLENWSLRQDDSTQTRRKFGRDIKPGDILIYTFSHCGFATSAPNANGYVKTVEGNTDANGSREGGGVFAKLRHVSKIKARIRFTV